MKNYKSTSHTGQKTEFHLHARLESTKPDITAGEILFTPTHLILILLISHSPHRAKIIHWENIPCLFQFYLNFRLFAIAFVGSCSTSAFFLSASRPLLKCSCTELTKCSRLCLSVRSHLKFSKSKHSFRSYPHPRSLPLPVNNSFITSTFQR